MVSIMEIMHLCRLCLVKEQVNIPIFEDQGDIRQIFLKITACLPVKISKEDKLPKKICDGCLYKLELLYQFWNTTANAEKQLLTWVEQIKMDVNTKKTEEIDSPSQEHTVKQEKIEPESTNDNIDISTEAQNYILQQQQLAYSAEYPFKESQGSKAESAEAENSDEPLSKRRRRRQASKPIPPESLDSSDNEADNILEMTVTKTEEESESDGDENVDDSESPKFAPAGAEDSEQPGPSGLGKGGAEAPILYQDNIYANFNYQQDIVCEVDDSMQSKYYMIMKNAPELADSNLLENAVAQLNDSDTDLLNLLAAEDDILRDITDNEQFEQLINNGVMESENEYNAAMESVTENISVLIKDNDFTNFCDKVDDTIKEVDDKTVREEKKNVELSEDAYVKCGDSFKCAYCQKICSTKKLLKNHVMIHTGSRPYSCDVCGKSFRHNYNLTVHKKSHSKPTYQCDICPKMFIHKSHLTAHRKKHLGNFAAFCSICDRGFVSQSVYNQHVKVKHEKVMHICEICGAKLSTVSALKEHKLTHEPNYRQQRIHVCEFCGKSYLNARHLRGHVKSHFNTYSCNVCGKSFTMKSNLRKHMANHSDERKFHCSLCSKSFNTKENLTAHERTHLPMENRPFKCDICDKGFIQKISLTVHMRYHTGERPYKCDCCGKAFYTKSHLVGHYKRHQIDNIDVNFVP